MMSVPRSRLTAALVVFAALALFGGCSSDGDDAATTTDASGSASSTTVPDPAKFNETLERLDGEIDAAQGDICELLGVLDKAGGAGSPTTPDQASTAAGFIAKAYRAIADAAPDEVSTEAARVREAADAIVAETEAPDFDPEAFITNGPTAFTDQEFVTAVSAVFASVGEECGVPAAGAEG